MRNISDGDALVSDIHLFNRIMHTAAAAIVKEKRDTEVLKKNDPDAAMLKHLEAMRRPDARTKEGRMAKGDTLSLHMSLKRKFAAEDHFTNSAVNAASAAIRSKKELSAIYVEDTKADIAAVTKKLNGTKKTLKKRIALKNSLIDISKARKKGGRVPDVKGLDGYIRKDPASGKFYIQVFGVKMREWANDYLFELWLDGEIRKLKARVRSLSMRKTHLEARLSGIDKRKYSVCFGTRKLHGKKASYPDLETWQTAWRKKRSRAMMISGRADARQGNFRVRYDSVSHTLTYKAQSGKAVTMPCVFPYGQSYVDEAVNASKEDRHAVAWRFEITGGSILVRCIVYTPETSRRNDCFLTGCISFDMNYDNISVTELDGSGNILRHKVITFDLEGCSCERSEHILSKALEEVFRMAHSAGKPVAMEDLSIKIRKHMYGDKKVNRKLSRFSYSIITGLTESKSRKYGIYTAKTDPAYTSQSGKIKYCRKYGITVHEAAAAAIGRRAMGYIERLPSFLKAELKDDQKRLPAVKQWAAVYGITKKLKPSALYRMPMAAAAGKAV